MILWKISHISFDNNVHTVHTFVVASTMDDALTAFRNAWKKKYSYEPGEHHGTGTISKCEQVKLDNQSPLDVIVGQ